MKLVGQRHRRVMSNSESEVTEENIDFGSLLSAARKAQNYTVDQISEHIKIPVHYIVAIENNELKALPADTFARGYIRAYARFLEISDKQILELYERAVPQDHTKTLKPRSNLPGEASSQSPLIKTITMLLIFAVLGAVIYGSFQYYQEKAGVMGSERDGKQTSFTGSSLDSPSAASSGAGQEERLMDDAATQNKSDSVSEVSVSSVNAIDEQDAAVTEAGEEVSATIPENMAEMLADKEIPENDVLEIFAENGSWVDVRDASDSRLFNNLIAKGDTKVIQGKAPFHIALGNAKTTRVLINDLELDMVKYIRPNNTVKITVSTEEQKVIIH
jgi:cytoskeleton protein RodZ